MRCLSFTVDRELYAVDVTLVQKVARKMTVTPIPSAPDAVLGIANMKGSVVTLLSLYRLLDRKERTSRNRAAHIVNAVVFKSTSGSEDQMGLVIDKPGGLVDIGESAIRAPSGAGAAVGASEERLFISGIAEADMQLYRIISIDAIMSRYIRSVENQTEVN